MMLLSCVNCCHNPLQTESLGTSVGYCTDHRKVLLAPSQLTCGRHLRKDLVGARATALRTIHERCFSPTMVARLTKAGVPANGAYTSTASADLQRLASDEVGGAVLDFGRLESKIASLAQLKFLSGVRPEIAMLSLARAYVEAPRYQADERGAIRVAIREALCRSPGERFFRLRAGG